MPPKKKPKEHKTAPARAEQRRKSPAKSKSASEAPLPEIISETIVEYLHETEGESPLNLEWENFIKIRADSIEWNNYNETPIRLQLRNSAYNVVLTGEWPPGLSPYVSKGPLATKYEFAQIHFHWGPDSSGGSDHDIEGKSYPFESHLVFYKSSSGSLEEAKKEEDGIVTFCYLHKVMPADNDKLKPITDSIKNVTLTYSTVQLAPAPLKGIFNEITDDYIVYLGFMKYKAVHGVTFIVSRDVNAISENQLAMFRELKDRHENPMILKKREVYKFDSRNVFVVNPKSTALTSVLNPFTGGKMSIKTKSSSGKRSMTSRSSRSTRSSRSRKRSSRKSKSGRRSGRSLKKKRSSSKKKRSSSKKKRSSSKKKRSSSKKKKKKKKSKSKK